jgi:adenylate cyclase
MAETRKIAAILAADVVGFSRMASADEDRTLARLRALRADVIDPIVRSQNGRVFKRTGDGALVEFRSVVEAVRCAISVQNAMVERNVGSPEDQRIVFRIGIHLGDVVEESDGDLMGDGVNIAARLEGVAAPGAICLSEDAYRQVKGRLDLAVTDLGPTQLKNIAEPVRAYSLQVGVPAQAKSTLADPSEAVMTTRRAAFAPIALAIVAALIVAGGAAWYLAGGSKWAATVAWSGTAAAPVAEPAKSLPHLSIVVLPFANLSNDPSQDYFADGITENLTTDLSRIHDSFVIARNTAFTYKGKAVDAKEIGKSLGVRYVLEGSAQRYENRVRVNAQLIDTATGAHIWADRFEEDLADLFKLQDQVVARLANALRYELVKAEAGKSAGSKNPDVIDLNMRGMALLQVPFTKDKISAARALYERTLTIDPDNSDALAGDASTYWVELSFFGANPEIDYEAKILGQDDRAIASAPDNAHAYRTKSSYLLNSSRLADGLRAADAALAIEPSSALSYAQRGYAELSLLQFEQGKLDVQQAMRLSPRDQSLTIWHNLVAEAELGLGNIDLAIDELGNNIAEGHRTWYTFVDLAAAQARKGDIDEAKAALAEALRINPKLSIKYLSVRHSLLRPSFDALRKVGLPEE